MLLEKADIALAMELHRRTHRLILWIDGSIRDGFIPLEAARSYLTDRDVAEAWLAEHMENLPPDGRPLGLDPENLRPFSNMLVSYLQCSFDVVDSPGMQYVPGRLRKPSRPEYLPTPHFQPKKLNKKHRRRARHLKVDFIKGLGIHAGVEIGDAEAESYVDDGTLAGSISQATYGFHLIRRMGGWVDGPSLLALWREFAWTKSGSPRKDVSLTTASLLEAQALIVDKIESANPMA